MFNRLLPIYNWIKRHKYLVVTTVFVLIMLVGGDNNLLNRCSNKLVIAELENEIKSMQRDSAEIISRQSQLDFRNVEAVEELARDKYGMQKDNEDVFIIED